MSHREVHNILIEGFITMLYLLLTTTEQTYYIAKSKSLVKSYTVTEIRASDREQLFLRMLLTGGLGRNRLSAHGQVFCNPTIGTNIFHHGSESGCHGGALSHPFWLLDALRSIKTPLEA